MKTLAMFAALFFCFNVTNALAWDNWPPKTFSNSNGDVTLDDPMFTPVGKRPDWLKIGVTLFIHPKCETTRCEQLNAANELEPIHSFKKNIQVRGQYCDAVLLGWQGTSGYPYRCLDEIVNSGNFYIRADDPVLQGKAPQSIEKSNSNNDSEHIGISQEEFDKLIPPSSFGSSHKAP
ncbi:hypothetical protein [Aeromonas enteropelogenes]|uniref:hypothetical protein n=1 Tax=Aeromonas enteropelogenes TaxID=29489 RepID=UPI003BA338AD